jgi:hypothetical protein
MRSKLSFSLAAPALLLALGAFAGPACSGGNTPGFQFGNDAGGGSGSGGGSSSSGGGSGSGSGGLGNNVFDDGGAPGGDGGTVTTTIYAHNDTTLYSMNPATKALTLIGTFSGSATITDLAVNAAGEVYVNSESVIYKASLPAGGTGTVQLTTVATISVQSGQRFYALGFTPKDALGAGTGEVLIGGDGNGELWAIDTSSGAEKDLGSFGPDPNDSSATLALSGDVTFYMLAGKPTGLATIRSCTTSSKGSSSCSTSSDYLAGIDMTALAAAYSSGTPAANLNAGIYGSPAKGQTGPGTGFGDVFGLGVWGGEVYGFTRGAGSSNPSLISIATSGASAGVGTQVSTSVTPSGSGWAGAGVTSSVTVTVQPPPPLK